MKKLFFILSLLVCVAYTSPVVSQERVIGNTEQIIDKYLAKAGTMVDSVLIKVTPVAEQAFKAYVVHYKTRGLVNLILLVFLFIVSGIALFYGVKLGEEYEYDGWPIPIIITSALILIVSLIVLVVCGGDLISQITTPEYWVLQDILGRNTCC